MDTTAHGSKTINPVVSTNVDTAEHELGYKAGSSSTYTLYDVKDARHVDVRPRNFKFQTETAMSQLRPLKYDREEALLAASQFIKFGNPYHITWEELRQHVILMQERVTFFIKNYGKLYTEPNNFIFRSIADGPSFNNWYAKQWKDARFEWSNTERYMPINTDELVVPFESYNSTFPPWYLIFWGEEPDDYLWMQEEAPPVDHEVLAEISDIVAGLSEKLLPSADFSVPDSVVWAPLSSNGFDGYDVTTPEWCLEYEAPEMDWEDNTLHFMRGFALKRPTESRDIGTLTPQSLRLHRRIMYPLQQACKRLDPCVYGRDKKYIMDRITYIGERCRYFFMRDYTKSGMTIHHETIKAVLRGFYRRDSALCDKALRAFEGSVVYIKEGDQTSFFRPKTGLPLGMFVEGYTLLQYAMNTYICQQIGKSVEFDGNNDDMIAGSLHQDVISAYASADMALQADLGMSVKGTKTGTTIDRFIYCEEYWDGERILPKDVLTSLALLGARFAINIVHAKELCHSILMSAGQYHPGTVLRALTSVQSAYQYEFSEQETRWPYLFGGWLPTYIDGLDASILWRNGDSIADCAYWACRERTRMKHKFKDKATLAFGRKKCCELLEIPDNPADWLALQPLFGDRKTLKDYFSLISRAPREIKRKYVQLYLKRQAKFRGFLTGKEDCPSVTSGWLRRHPNSVIPPGLVGVKYTTQGTIVGSPRIGVRLSSVDARLHAMMAQGFISCSISLKLSNSEKKLHSMGITDELVDDFVPMAPNGIPLSYFQLNLRGLQDLWLRHRLFVQAIDDGDVPVTPTRHWAYIPLPLVWIIRVETAVRVVPTAPPFNQDTALWYFKAVTGIESYEEFSWEILQHDDLVEANVQVDDAFESLLRSLLDSFDLSNIRAKIVPRSSDDHFQGNLPAMNTSFYEGREWKEIAPGFWVPVTEDEIPASGDGDLLSGSDDLGQLFDT